MNAFLLALNYSITALVAGLCWRKRSFRLIDPGWAFLGGYFINYCIRPTLFLIDPELGSAYAGMYDATVIRRAFSGSMVFALVGLTGFALGSLWLRGTAGRLAGFLPHAAAPRDSDRQMLTWISFFLLMVGVAGLYGFISQAGWEGTVVELLQGGVRNASMQVIFGNGLYMFAMELSLLGWAILWVGWLTSDLPKKRGPRIRRRMAQIAAFLLTLGIWIAFGERSTILAVLFIPVALRNLLKKKTRAGSIRTARQSLKLIAAVALIVLTFAVAGPLGLLMKGMDLSPAAAVNLSISAWDSFEFTVIAQNQVHARNLFLGSTYAGDIFYTWLPRAVFPWKPARYGSVRVQDLVEPGLMDNEGATFPTGILVEAFCNFGYPGLFFVPLLIGILCQVLYQQVIHFNWLWMVLTAICFTNLASFRGFGGFVAFLLAYAASAYFILALIRILQRVRISLADCRPQWHPRLN